MAPEMCLVLILSEVTQGRWPQALQDTAHDNAYTQNAAEVQLKKR